MCGLASLIEIIEENVDFEAFTLFLMQLALAIGILTVMFFIYQIMKKTEIRTGASSLRSKLFLLSIVLFFLYVPLFFGYKLAKIEEFGLTDEEEDPLYRLGFLVLAIGGLIAFISVISFYGSVYKTDMPLDAALFYTLLGELKVTLGGPAEKMMHRAGQKYGKKMVEKISAPEYEDPLEFYVKKIETSMFGRIKNLSKRGEGRLLINFSHDPRVKSIMEDNLPCSFIKGYLEGVANQIHGGEYEATETTCQTKGQEFCTFEVGPKTTPG